MDAIAHDLRRGTEGLGRRLAALALIVFLGLQIGAPALLDMPRLALFDAYERFMPRHRDPHLAPVVIVSVDDASLAATGRQWPWPRTLQARLIQMILNGHPAALGADIIWSEASGGGQPDAQGPNAGASTTESAASADRSLAAVVGAGPVAVGVAGVGGDETPPGSVCGRSDADPGPFVTVVIAGGGASVSPIRCFDSARRSLPEIDAAAPGHGLISNDPDQDGVFRHLRLVSSVAGRAAPDLSLEVYRLAAKAPWITLYAGAGGRDVRGVGVGASTFPTEHDGALWIDFTPRDEWPVISASDILAGKTPPSDFDRRLVLLGVTAVGQVDQLRSTPREAMSGLEINAQGLENLVAGRLAHRPAWASIVEPGLTLTLGLFLIGVLPSAWRGWRVAAALAPLAALAIGGIFAWHAWRLFVDVASPAIGCAAVVVAMLGGGLAEADAQRRRLRREVEISRLGRARTEGELEAGRRIQMGILPTPESLAPDARFDLDAVMVPARQIGGDLYDFFKIDEDHLFIAVGDVSGKGLPASLFMALGKSLCKSCALRGERDVGAILRRANEEISRDNPEMLFITLFAGILDLRTGELAFCNAGHDAPFLLRANAAPQAVVSVGGPPLCVADGFPYVTEMRRLEPGDGLCLTTDGVTEAMTAAGELMGRDRVDRVLGEMAPRASARTITRGLQEAVGAYVAGADPSDDLTILTVRWNGSLELI